MKYSADYKYIESNGIKLFTVVLLPDSSGKFPVVVFRNPYMDVYENWDESDVVIACLNDQKRWLKNGYAVVFQHCRGRGKSTADCIPYINEREDGIALREWIRQQPFYNGEIFLCGHSYSSSVHYTTAPFEDDIKGAVFGVQDSERYNICYRNGFLKKALHGSWYVNMYKAKSHMKKNFTKGSFDMLPLKDFTKTVFGEYAEDFDQMLKAPNPGDEFWNTRFGGNDARDATNNVKFPILFTTGFYDIYTGGVFEMWNSMSEESRRKSALIVSPYDHGDNFDADNAIEFPNGKPREYFGQNFDIEWFDFIRGTGQKKPFDVGVITYYNLFENRWESNEFLMVSDEMKLCLGDNEVSYVYNPFDPPTFKGGLSRAFGGTVYQDNPNSRHDIISVYSDPFEADVYVKGKMSAKLKKIFIITQTKRRIN